MAEENKGNEVNQNQQAEQPGAESSAPSKPATEKSVEQRYEELMVEFAKLKRASDKNASEAADWRKKYQSTLSEKEQMDMEKAEAAAKREEEYQALLRENRINKLEKTYLGLGYLPDEAAQMAVAEVDGDFDTRVKLMNSVDSRKKKEYEAEWLKTRPEINAGTDAAEEDPFIKGFKSVNNFKR